MIVSSKPSEWVNVISWLPYWYPFYLEQPGLVEGGWLLSGLHYWFPAAVLSFVYVLHQQEPYPCLLYLPLQLSHFFYQYLLWKALPLAWNFLQLTKQNEDIDIFQGQLMNIRLIALNNQMGNVCGLRDSTIDSIYNVTHVYRLYTLYAQM